MQTIKCVVVGDGAVGKVSGRVEQDMGWSDFSFCDLFNFTSSPIDMLVDFLHYEQVPRWTYSDGTFFDHMWGEDTDYPRRFSITMLSPS
jgi:hypothetical protein